MPKAETDVEANGEHRMVVRENCACDSGQVFRAPDLRQRFEQVRAQAAALPQVRNEQRELGFVPSAHTV
jgi:hypothetical protein